MSAPAKSQWVVVHKGGQPIAQLEANVPFLAPFNVRDAVRGIGYCGIQQNMSTKYFGIQSTLKVEFGQLNWQVEVRGNGPGPSLINWPTIIGKLNQASLGSTVNNVTFGFANQGNRLVLWLDLKDLNGSQVFYAEQDVPAKYIGDILSSFVTLCGWGDASQALFDNGFNTKVVYQGLLGDALQTTSFPAETPAVPVLFTMEGNNLYQKVELNVPQEVSVVTAQGSWM